MNYNNLVAIKDRNHNYRKVSHCLTELFGCQSPNDLLGFNDFDLASNVYSNSLCKSEIIAEDEICLRGNRALIFQVVRIQGIFDYQLVHKSPFMSADNKSVDGVIVHLTRLVNLSPLAIQSFLDCPSIIVSNHTKLTMHHTKIVAQQNNKITKRELECIELLVKGYSAKIIATKLKLSIRSVEYYIRNIKEKLNVSKTVDIVALALREGIV